MPDILPRVSLVPPEPAPDVVRIEIDRPTAAALRALLGWVGEASEDDKRLHALWRSLLAFDASHISVRRASDGDGPGRLTLRRD